MTEPSDVLGCFDRWGRFQVGFALYGLADRLAAMTAAEIEAFGVVLCGEASGLMRPRDVEPGQAREALACLSARLVTFLAARAEVDEDPSA